MPIFLRSVPERNPRTECGCQPVAFISSLAVAPPDRFSRSIILAALLPSRAESDFFAPLRGWGAFLAEVVFFPAFPFLGATWARRVPTGAPLVAFGSGALGVSVCSVMLVMVSPCAVVTASMTSITLFERDCKAILRMCGRCYGDAR